MTADDHDLAPDPVIQTALRLLPVPEHRPSFWLDLDARLDAGPDHAGAVRRDGRRALVPMPDGGAEDPARPRRGSLEVVELEPDASLALVPPALRRRSNLLLSAVAVAAAVMVVVAGTTLVRERSGDGAGTTEVASSADDPATSSTTTDATPTSGAAADATTAAVMAWIGALGQGDTATAWDAMGPASKDHFGSSAAFAAQGSALAEGYGAWSAVTPDEVLVTPLAGAAGDLVVITLVGTVPQEGTEQRRADAFPVRLVDGTPRVEPFAFAGELEIVVPEPVDDDGTRPAVHRDEPLVVVVPRGVEAPTIRLDDGEALICGEAAGTELSELEGTPGQRCSYLPEGGIEAGRRVLTVAFLAPDGSGVAAESVLFEAA